MFYKLISQKQTDSQQLIRSLTVWLVCSLPPSKENSKRKKNQERLEIIERPEMLERNLVKMWPLSLMRKKKTLGVRGKKQESKTLKMTYIFLE